MKALMQTGDDIGEPGKPHITKKKGFSSRHSMDNVRFEKIDGVWVPMECDRITHVCLGSPDKFTKDEVHFKRTKIQLNPDHDALGSFLDPLKNPGVDPELVNGARVNFGDGIRRTWINGKAVADVDDTIIDELDKIVDQLKADLPDTQKKPLAKLTALDVLGKYRRSQTDIRSLIAKARTTTTVKGSAAALTESEFATDGLRFMHRFTQYPGLHKISDYCAYGSFVYAGKYLIEYSKLSPSDLGEVLVSKDYFKAKTLVSKRYKGAGLLGKCPGDIQRVDHILKKTKGIKLVMTQETVGKVQCYCIEAKTESGIYKLWFDPAHGFNLAKIIVQRKPSDKVVIDMYSGKNIKFTMDNVVFQKISGFWVPMQAHMELSWNHGKNVSKWHHKRTQVLINPDHKAFRSFFADDIPDGTEISSNRQFVIYQGSVTPKGQMEKIKNEN
jgi:hypothetical protein